MSWHVKCPDGIVRTPGRPIPHDKPIGWVYRELADSMANALTRKVDGCCAECPGGIHMVEQGLLLPAEDQSDA